MRGLLRPMSKMILNAGSTGRQSCFCYSNLINMPGHTRTAKNDVMVMLRTSNCTCNILEMRPSFDAWFLLLMICCRLLSTIKLLRIWSKKCQNNHVLKVKFGSWSTAIYSWETANEVYPTTWMKLFVYEELV